MSLPAAALLTLAQLTLQSPRRAARVMMAAKLPRAARWLAMALTAVLSAILAHVSFALVPADIQAELGDMSPIISALTQSVTLVLSGLAMYGLGLLFGGQGKFDDALLLTVWLQFMMLGLQVVQIVVQILFPSLALVIGYASIFLFMWIISNFTAELHGFRSALKTFFGVLAAMILVGMVIAPFMMEI